MMLHCNLKREPVRKNKMCSSALCYHCSVVSHQFRCLIRKKLRHAEQSRGKQTKRVTVLSNANKTDKEINNYF